MTTLSQRGTRRKITVNERVEQILHGDLQAEADAEQRTATAAARDEQAMRRSRQLSHLYTSSLEDKFVRARSNATTDTDGAKSVPKNARLGQRKVLDVPPIESTSASPLKLTKCYAKHMLEQVAIREEEERRRIEATQFRAPDFAPTKPWYTGYSSRTKAPSGTVEAEVRRYGAYGVVKMLASETVGGTAPTFQLHTSQSLDQLTYKDTPDAWSPTLHGSPTLWPEDANYATGCGLSPPRMRRCPSPNFRFPSHVVGRMEPLENDGHYARMQQVHAQDTAVLESALEEEKQRRKQEIQYNKEKHMHWQEQLHFEPLSSKMDHPFLKIPTVNARAVTILQTSEYSPLVKHDEQVLRLHRERFTLRWYNLGEMLDVMKKTPCRRPVLQDIEKLLALAYDLSLKNLNHLELSRAQFVELFQREYPVVTPATVNRVFSSYDWRLEDRIDMRLFLATVRAMRVQQGTALEMLSLALQDFDITRQQVVGKAAHFMAVMSMCSASEDEEKEMQTAASDVWSRMIKQYIEDREQKRQRRLRGLEMDPVPHDPSLLDTTTPNDDCSNDGDDTLSAIDSLVFLGREGVEQGVSIKFVRRALRQEKVLLQRFTDMLVKRREEYAAMAVPAKSTRQ